jgi:hypothetical protein
MRKIKDPVVFPRVTVVTVEVRVGVSLLSLGPDHSLVTSCWDIVRNDQDGAVNSKMTVF